MLLAAGSWEILLKIYKIAYIYTLFKVSVTIKARKIIVHKHIQFQHNSVYFMCSDFRVLCFFVHHILKQKYQLNILRRFVFSARLAFVEYCCKHAINGMSISIGFSFALEKCFGKGKNAMLGSPLSVVDKCIDLIWLMCDFLRRNEKPRRAWEKKTSMKIKWLQESAKEEIKIWSMKEKTKNTEK